MEEMKDFEDQNKWGATMDRQSHLKGYKNFIRAGIAVAALTVLVLIFMAAFLT